MAQVHHLFQTFNAGELSPLLGARFGVEKVASGCRKLRNFLLHVHGPAFRRPGMEYMGASTSNAAKSRLFAFHFSTTTGAVIELHPSGLRVWSNGLLVPLVNPVTLPYSESECQEVQMAQVNDVCYLTHPNHAPRKLVRYADNDWRISEPSWKWPAMGDPSALTTDQAPVPTILMSSPRLFTGEFSAPDRAITITVTNPNLDATEKRLRLQHWSNGFWATETTRTWTTTQPAPITSFISRLTNQSRLYYVGAIGPSGSVATGVWSDGSVALPLGSVEDLNTVTVPAGEWQATMSCPSSIPGGSAVYVERYNGSAWVNQHTFALVPSAVLTYRGPTLSAATQIRIRWTGAIMDNGGTATVDQLIFPPALDVTITPNAASGSGRILTASAAIFLPAHVGSYWQISHRREQPYVTITATAAGNPGTPVAMPAQTSAPLRVSGGWQVLTYGTWDSTLYLERLRGTTWEVVRSWESNNDRNVAVSGEEETTADLRLRIATGTATKAGGVDVPRFTLEATDSIASGLVKIKAVGPLTGNGKSLTATADIVSALYSTTATPLWEEGAWSAVRGYPRTVALHGERLWFGGTRAEPMRVWGSVVADYEDFRRTTYDDASVSFTPAAMSSNPIQWMLSREKELVIGTGGDEWTLGTESGPITPVNVLMQRRSSYGSEYVPALLLNEVIVFVQRGARKVRQVAPRADIESWAANDLTVLAEHIARSGIRQTASMAAPFSVLWCVTNDGKLLGMTFEQEQNVFGWHVHTTDGTVESVAVLRAADADEVWLSVYRDGMRCIERLDPLVVGREFTQRNSLIYLDCATRFTSDTPVASVTGLERFEGREVCIVGDGAEQSAQTVEDGTVTLDPEASEVIVGLPYTSELQPMRMELPMRDGTAQGREWRVSRVYLTVEDSIGGEIADSPTGSRWEPINYRTAAMLMDTAPSLLSGETETPIESTVRHGVDVIVRQVAPLPLNVGSIVVKADIYGE